MTRINVKFKPTGEMGTVEEAEFSPDIYERTDISSPVQPTTPGPEQQVKKSLAENIGGGVMGLVKGIAKPFVQTGKTIGGAVYEGGRAIKSAMGDKNAYVNQETGEVQQNPFLSEQELAGARDISDPEGILRKQLGASANVASYAIPFGKARGAAGLVERVATKAALPGAAVGAIQGATKEGANAESVIGDALLGAAGGVALHGAGKIPGVLRGAGQAAEKTGTGIRSGVTNIKNKPSIYEAGESKAIKKTLEELGINGSPQKQYEMLEPKMNELGGKIDQYLAKNPGAVSTDIIKDKFANNIKSSLRTKDLTSGAAKSEMDGYLQDLMDSAGVSGQNTIDTKDVFNMKKVVNGDYGAIAKKIESDMPLNSREKVVVAFRKTLDDTIAEAHPELKKLTTQQSHLYDAASSLSRERFATPTVRALGITLPTPIMKSGQDAIGRGVQGAGQNLQKVGNVLPDISSNVAGQVGSRALLNNPGDQPNQEDNSVNNNNSGYNADNNVNHADILPSQPQTLNPYGATPEILYREYQNALDAGDTKTATRLKGMYSDEVTYQKQKNATGKPKSAAGLQVEGKAKAGLNALNTIESAISADPSIIVKAAIPGSPGARQFEASLSSLTDALGGLRTGATVSKEQLKFYRSMLPKIGDSPETIAKKLQDLRTELSSYVAGSGSIQDTPSADTLPNIE